MFPDLVEIDGNLSTIVIVIILCYFINVLYSIIEVMIIIMMKSNSEW